MRRSLFARLLVASVLIAVCAVGATAYLAVRTTTVAIEQEQGRTFAADADAYDQLVGHAAAHPDWSGVEGLLRGLAHDSNRRLVLVPQDGSPAVDTDPGKPLPDKPSATVDALNVDVKLDSGGAKDGIDRRAVGPFRLTPEEQRRLTAVVEQALPCVRQRTGSAELVTEPSGRPRIESPGLVTTASCQRGEPNKPTPTEQAALEELNKLVNACVQRKRGTSVTVKPDLSWVYTAAGPAPAEEPAAGCLREARREQLDPYVAPPALLYATGLGGAPSASLDLSPENKSRIVWVAVLVLLFTVAVTVLVGRRLVRPLRALTGAAQRMRDGDGGAEVAVTGRDEIARLATAFNDMAAHRRRVEETRKAMVSDIAHELRTPLSNIRGWLEAAEDGVARPDDQLITFLLSETRHLQRIIDDLQDLAVADAGRLRVHPERLRVADLVDVVVAGHRAAAEAAGVRLTGEAPEELELEADPVRMRQALGNLVANAVRHTPAGGRVSVRVHDDEISDEVLIEVADTGTGIAEEDLPHVFDRFWRAEKSRSRASGGSGLGLSIVRQLVSAHGGYVDVRSVLGEGSVFTVSLDKAAPPGEELLDPDDWTTTS
ncbi:two-component system sensor histidine kinase BaeS [Crossiella equi]|uniref:histidine kinase n=1 Tax=Crossiella equi TaxID=130796 RepID=A0ABS5AN10_9PSEU|nr:HAMP domain-containing sensor histidine kinase [Crossiella equi]MBP2477968.1 two-component system sensor histidine kinase BaeS [Crossiella equi]